MQILSAQTNEELHDIAVSEGAELLEQSGCSAPLSAPLSVSMANCKFKNYGMCMYISLQTHYPQATTNLFIPKHDCMTSVTYMVALSCRSRCLVLEHSLLGFYPL